MKRPSLYNLCATAFHIGCIAYGGPANLVVIKKAVVHDHAWLPEREFVDSLSLAQILPGATGVSMMAHIGYHHQKFWGGLLVPFFYIFPAIVSMMVLSWAYFTYGHLPAIQSVMAGIGALVVALMANATLRLGEAVFQKNDAKNAKGALIALLSFSAMRFTSVNTAWIILFSGFLGLLFFHFTHEFEHEVERAGSTELDVPVHADRGLHPLDFIPLALLALTLLAIAVLSAPLLQILTAFFHIGLFAFGGGYAAIPLMQHQVVDVLHWVNLTEFRDGISIGQITPGPVSTTVAFIGYKLSGFWGALVASLAIFLAPIGTMIALSSFHAKVRQLKLTRVIVKGFSTGFIGLLAGLTLGFALKSLVSPQTWLISIASFTAVFHFKKKVWLMILATLLFSLAFIR